MFEHLFHTQYSIDMYTTDIKALLQVNFVFFKGI